MKRGRYLVLLKCPEKRRWREELLESKRPHFNERMVLRKLLNVTNCTEQRNLGATSLRIKYEWEIQAKKTELSQRSVPELDFM